MNKNSVMHSCFWNSNIPWFNPCGIYPSCNSLAVSCLIFLVSTTICQLSPVCRVPRAIIQMTSWSAASDDGGIFDNGSKRHIYYLPPGALYAVVVLEISISSDISHKKEATYLLPPARSCLRCSGVRNINILWYFTQKKRRHIYYTALFFQTLHQ